MDEGDSIWDSGKDSKFEISFSQNEEATVLSEEAKNLRFEECTDLDFEVRETDQLTICELIKEDENQEKPPAYEECTDLDFSVRESIEPIANEDCEEINAGIDGEGNTALHIAVREENESTILDLLSKGADANRKNIAGNTSVHEAVFRGNLKILRLLVENGGDINMTGQHGLLPLEMAAMSENEKCLAAILDCKPDINKKDDKGNTTLIHYVNEYYECITDILRLLEHGSDPNIRNKLGWNCLHLIAVDWQMNKGVLVRALIEYGIDINAELPEMKLTALHLAYSNFKNEYLVHILLQNDAAFTKNLKKYKPYDSVSCNNLTTIVAHAVLREHHRVDLKTVTFLSEVSASTFARAHRRCKSELDYLKRTKIAGFSLTYYDFLFCSREESCKLSLKKQFRIEVAKSVHFAIYSDFLLDKLYQGIQLRRANINVCYFLSDIFKIPFVCCEEIVRNFSTKELLFLQRRLEIS